MLLVSCRGARLPASVASLVFNLANEGAVPRATTRTFGRSQVHAVLAARQGRVRRACTVPARLERQR